MKLCDDAMVHKELDGSEYDFANIYNQYRRLVYAEAHKFLNDFHEIEDISQEVFLRVFTCIKMFNPEYRLSTWITTITKNLCKDKIRKQKRFEQNIDINSLDDFIVRNDVTPEISLINKELTGIIHSAIIGLPDKYRLLIVLYYFEGLSYNELTQILNEPITIVKNRLYRAKIMIRKRFADTNVNQSVS